MKEFFLGSMDSGRGRRSCYAVQFLRNLDVYAFALFKNDYYYWHYCEKYLYMDVYMKKRWIQKLFHVLLLFFFFLS